VKIKIPLVFITGLIMGVSAAAAQAFFSVQPPVAFGICMLGHPAIMTKWLLNNIFETGLAITPIFVSFPTLLVVGVLIGSYAAAYQNKELSWRPGPVRNRYMAAMFGFLVVNFGLLWGACPIRTGLLIAYGQVIAVIALFSIAVGVILACLYIRSRVKKETFKCTG
jgi:hypothetical protein